MHRIFLFWGLLFTLIFCCNSVLAYTFTVYEPPEFNQNGYNSYPKITKLEQIVLNKTYESEDIESRLNRLEQKTCSKTYSGADLAWRVDNITNKIDQSELYNISSKELAAIEKKVLGRSYKKDDLSNRLSRLEYQILGATQSGKPDERYQTILTASNHYMNFDNAITTPLNTITSSSVSPITATGGIKNAFKNVFHTITNAGSLTGYTPPISPYGYSAPYGFDPRYGTYGPKNPLYGYGMNPYSYNMGMPSGYHRSIRTNRGYYNMNRNCGSGMGVRILD